MESPHLRQFGFELIGERKHLGHLGAPFAASERCKLAEHQTIVAALNKLREAAERAGHTEIVAFAEALVEHAQTEEEVMYPAALLVGQLVRQRLGQHAPAVA